MLANLATPLLGLVDTAIMGRSPDPVLIAAVAVGSTVLTVLFWAFSFLRQSTVGLTAQALGAGDAAELAAALLRPLALQSQQRQLYAELVRRPRIEPMEPLPEGPWVQVLPQGHTKKMPIVEPVKKENPDLEPQTLIRTEHAAAVIVPEDGKNARRIVVNCEIPGQLGGQLGDQLHALSRGGVVEL